MTTEDRKLIYDYCGWKIGKDVSPWHDFTGNDILEAVTVMESKGGLFSFEDFIRDSYYENVCGKSKLSYYLQNFFELMAEWLKERKT
jgi:hypothetical protein